MHHWGFRPASQDSVTLEWDDSECSLPSTYGLLLPDPLSARCSSDSYYRTTEESLANRVVWESPCDRVLSLRRSLHCSVLACKTFGSKIFFRGDEITGLLATVRGSPAGLHISVMVVLNRSPSRISIRLRGPLAPGFAIGVDSRAVLPTCCRRERASHPTRGGFLPAVCRGVGLRRRGFRGGTSPWSSGG